MKITDHQPIITASGRALLLLCLLYIALISGWISDDIKITFRQIWNLLHGDGITFNVGERVQAFSHPLWFLLLSAVAVVTRELFVTTLLLSIALAVGAVAVLLHIERTLGERESG